MTATTPTRPQLRGISEIRTYFRTNPKPVFSVGPTALHLTSDALRRRLDSKIVTTQLGNEAGAASVPNVLGRATTYAELLALAERAGLGSDLVVQTPYGDSGKTASLVAGEASWDRDADRTAAEELKAKKRIRNKAAPVEAVIIDVDEINDRWRELAAVDVWAQLIMKEPHDAVERLLKTPRAGTYHLDEEDRLVFQSVSTDWHQLTHEDEAFFLRVYGPGDYRFKGADLGVLVTKGRMLSGSELTERARRWITGIREMYAGRARRARPARVPAVVREVTQPARGRHRRPA